MTQDPTAYWKAENLAITPSDMTFGKLVLRSKTLVAMVKVSVELIEDAQNLSGLVEGALSSALALELDRAALFGEGGLEPSGLYVNEDINLMDMGTISRSAGSGWPA